MRAFVCCLVLIGGVISLAQQKERKPESSCTAEAWMLAKQNWTDGEKGADVIDTMCQVPLAKISDSRFQQSHDCRNAFAIPKVAMLFLTMGEMRHEALWALWYKQASQLVPRDCVSTALCHIRGAKGYIEDYSTCLSTGRGILQQQALFSVYVHPPPDYQLYNQDSLFHGTEIAKRVNSSWGTFDLAQVARNLMAAALEDPLNQRFMTISESCIPLYSPSVIYHQLMYAEKSRINACTTRDDWGRDEYRWTFRLEETTDGRLQKSMWRKNHQWLGLVRKHARLTVADEEIAAAFAKHCYSGKDPDFGGWWRTCFSDEHYFSTLLAFHGLDNETDCFGELTHTLWCPHCSGDERLHPKSYKPDETDVKKLKLLRLEGFGCDVEKAVNAAAGLIGSLTDFSFHKSCKTDWHVTDSLLSARCPLFARKFSNGSEAAAMHAVFSMLLKDSSRHQQRWDGACNATLSHPYNKAVQTPLAGMEDKADADGTSDGSSSVNDSATATREAGLEPEGPTVKQVGSSSRSSIREERRQARRRNRIRQPR